MNTGSYAVHRIRCTAKERNFASIDFITEEVMYMRILAILLLTSPLLIVLIFALFYYVPGLTTVASEIFLELVKKIKIFDMSLSLFEMTVSYQEVSIEGLFNAYIQLILQGALDAFYLGCCIFALKSVGSYLFKSKRNGNKYYSLQLSYPVWVYNIAGVCIGVALKSMFGLGGKIPGNILESIVTIILLIYGIVRMLTAGNSIKGKYKERNYKAQRNSFLTKLLVSILADAFEAIATVNLITCVLEGPRMIRDGAYLIPALCWCALSILLMFLTDLLKGKDR